MAGTRQLQKIHGCAFTCLADESFRLAQDSGSKILFATAPKRAKAGRSYLSCRNSIIYIPKPGVISINLAFFGIKMGIARIDGVARHYLIPSHTFYGALSENKGKSTSLLFRTRTVPTCSIICLTSRTALVCDPYAGWCGKGWPCGHCRSRLCPVTKNLISQTEGIFI